MPALVTVSNELGEPRTPSIKGVMAATRMEPTVWSKNDLGVDLSGLAKLEVKDLFIPVREKQCEMVTGEDDVDAGRKLALKLREAKII